MRSVWVTGACGFIGRHLARECAARGIAVAGLGHPPADGIQPGAWGIDVWQEGCVTTDGLNALANNADLPNAIFHLAGGSSVQASVDAPGGDYERSVGSTAHLLEWVRAEAPESVLVLASSAAVYGANHTGPIRECDECRPFSPYGRHKQLAETLCQEHAERYGIRVSIVRMFSVYGSHQRKQILWDICRRLADTSGPLTLSGNGDEERDFLHVSDAVKCLASSARWNTPPGSCLIANAGTGIGTRVGDLARTVASAWGSDVEIDFSGVSRPGDPKRLVADTSRVRALGWEPEVPLQQGVDKYVSWFRDARVAVSA